jgi:hypothetical protein
MLFVVHAEANSSGGVDVLIQHENNILGRLMMSMIVWRGLRRLLGSGVVGASTDGVSMRLIDSVQ